MCRFKTELQHPVARGPLDVAIPGRKPSGRGAGASRSTKKKGEPKFPQDQLILCCHVSSIDPGAKIRNLSGKTRGKDTSGHCSADRCQQKYGKQGTAKELQPPREVRLVDSARAGDGQARKDGAEQGDTAGSPQGSEEAACYGGLVTEANIGMAEKEGHQHIPREDIPDGPG